MTPTASSSQHGLFYAAQVTGRVAELIEDVRDRSSLFSEFAEARTVQRLKNFTEKSVLIPTSRRSRTFPLVGDLNAHNSAPTGRDVALLKTLNRNPHLSKAVLGLHICADHFEDIRPILATCPGVITLRLEVKTTTLFQNTRELARLPFPAFPPAGKRLEIIYYVQTDLTMEAFVKSFSNATSLRALSLDTTIETAQTILASCGRRLKSLRASGMRTGFISSTIYADLFTCVPHQTSLRLIAVVNGRVEDIGMTPMGFQTIRSGPGKRYSEPDQAEQQVSTNLQGMEGTVNIYPL